MTYLMILLLAAHSDDPTSIDKTAKNKTKKQTEIKASNKPDMELLLFLGAWDDSENDQWLDPEIFSADTNFNQQLDEYKATDDEQDPDHN